MAQGHAHHAADIDKPGTDSFRHRAAGAREVALVTDARYAILREQEETGLAEVLARLAPGFQAQLVLVHWTEPRPRRSGRCARRAAGQHLGHLICQELDLL